MKTIIKGSIYYAKLPTYNKKNQRAMKRVLIIQNNELNKRNNTVMVVPIAERKFNKKLLDTQLELNKFNLIKPNSIILLDRIMTIDKKELKGYVGDLEQEDMIKIDKQLISILGISTSNL